MKITAIVNNMTQDTKELAIVKQQSTKAYQAAEGLIIKTSEDMNVATDILSKIKTVQKLIKEKKESLTKPLNEALKNARALFAPIEDSAERAESIIKQKMVAYQVEEDKKVKIEEKKIMDRVERKTMTGNTALKKLDEIETPENTVETKFGGKAQFKEMAKMVIVNEKEVEDKYWVINEVALRADTLSAYKEGRELPKGVKVELEKKVSGYSK